MKELHECLLKEQTFGLADTKSSFLICFAMLFNLGFLLQIGLILYTGIKGTSCKITCVLKKNYWKVLLPCHSPSVSRGRTETSVSWDQNCSRPK